MYNNSQPHRRRSTVPFGLHSSEELRSVEASMLKDPVAVWQDMLSGSIAIPPSLVEKSRVHIAIEEEEELNGTMPDELWNRINGSREATAHAMRSAIRYSKKNIQARVAALKPTTYKQV